MDKEGVAEYTSKRVGKRPSAIVGLESVAMFGSFGLFAVWCYTM
jgi:hypothetical protein